MNNDFFILCHRLKRRKFNSWAGGGGKRERGGCCSVIGRAKLAVTEIIVKGWARRMFLKRQLMLRFDSNKSIVL